MTKGGAATAGVAAVGLLLAGCNPGGEGVRSEGSATSTPAPRGAASSSPAPTATAGYKKINAVELLKHDPNVGTDVKKSLAKPCSADEYPVDVTYATLTGGDSPDVIINVMTCGDSLGIGAYVFRKRGDGYENVYGNEQPPVYASDNKGELEVTRQTYDAGDKVCCPSGEDVLSYHWSDDHFTQYDSDHTDYSKTTASRTTVVDGSVSAGDTGSED